MQARYLQLILNGTIDQRKSDVINYDNTIDFGFPWSR